MDRLVERANITYKDLYSEQTVGNWVINHREDRDRFCTNDFKSFGL